MAQMERIIRPHLPANIAPADKAPKCYVPPENTEVALVQDPSASTVIDPVTGSSSGGSSSPQDKSRTSSWSHSYKLYMTKKEREISDPAKEKDGIVQEEGHIAPGGGGGRGPVKPEPT